MLFGLLFGGFAFWSNSKKIVSYEAVASFMAADNSSGSGGGLIRMVGQLGLGRRSQSVDADLLKELLSAKRMVYGALLREVAFEDGSDLLINRFVELEGTDKEVGKDNEFEGYRFTITNADSLDMAGHTIIKEVYEDIVDGYLDVYTSDDGIVYITLDTPHEALSRELAVELMNTLQDFYVFTSVEKQQSNLDIITERVDSIHNVVKNAQYALASWYEKQQNRMKAGTVSPKNYMRKVELERTAEVANVVYIEAVKSKELAEMELETKRPIIQIIDMPQYPLQKRRSSLILALILAGFLACTLSTVLIIINKIIRDALRPI